MKVYRNNIFLMNNSSDVPYKKAGSRWVNKDGKKVPLVPVQFTIIYTGSEFQNTTIGETTLTAGNYYYYNGRDAVSNIAIWELTDNETALAHSEIPIFNIMEGTYTGKDMGERSITAQIDFPSRIDFQIGDFVKFDIANLLRANGVAGGHGEEKFYIYTMPTVKKVARAQSFGKAFQHTVTFYPCQYELATVKMRDVLQEVSSGVIYTGYDEFSFYGGANTLMKRIIAVLNERFGNTGVPGKDYWSYQIADSINEDKNTALEKFQFDFSDSSVMDALLKLNDAEGINTKFFINERMIYVGYKRPYITGVDSNNIQRSVPFEFMYGKTSHMPIETNYGNLFTLTKSNGSASPITRLYAYGADRNLHRFYCSDRIKTGRYVNKLMLPSFEDDGRTDYIDSPEGIARFGIREGTKNFENIYPSLRFFYYGNLRDVKYCIKLMGSGLESDSDGVYDGGTSIAKASLTSEQIERAKSEVDRAKYDGITNTAKVIITVGGQDYTLTVAEADQLINKGTVHLNGKSGGVYNYPIARVQCYRVEELTKIVDGATVHTGLNRLVESAPPVDLAVFCHATGKVVKVVLYADKNGQTSIQRQLAADGKIPTRTLNGTDYIVGSCFAVHDANFGCGHIDAANTYPGRPNGNLREAWFQDADTISTDRDGTYDKDYEIYKNQVSIHQIHYTDDHWITDVYEFESYNQERFNRQGYSAYCWPRVNKHYPESQSDNIEVNAVVDVGPVLIEDTDLNTSEGKQQQTFDIYLRDVGFKINEQTWFGDRVFLFDTCKINFLDGKLAGYSFEMPSESDQAQLGSIYVPALKPDGSRNDEFFTMADNPQQAEEAFLRGAYWRIVAKRAETDVDRYYVPNVNLNASRGDHVVFLDIFMPDIYIRVAEQRLYKEAKKYLDANDDGDIQYSFDMDKVRPNEQPIFALQMREGAIMRVVDDDLDVGTVNKENMLFEDKDGLVSLESMMKLSTDIDYGKEIANRDLDYLKSRNIPYSDHGEEIIDGKKQYYVTLYLSHEDKNDEVYLESGITCYFEKHWTYERGVGPVDKWVTYSYNGIPNRITQVSEGKYRCWFDSLIAFAYFSTNYTNGDFKVGYSVKKTTTTTVYDETILPIGAQKFCHAMNLTEFKAGKYYEIVIDAIEADLVVEDTSSSRKTFALVNGLGDGEMYYYPEYTLMDITPEGEAYKRYKIAFTLGEEFNDNPDYYPAILYKSDGETEAVHVRLWSILERDDEHLGELNYVDLAIDTVTIKFHDNTREPGISLQDGQEPERLTTNQTEMVREVTATVKEESRASAWVQLSQRMDAAEQLQDQTLDFYQNLVIAARRHYIELMNLRNNIFDPDGTCKETFLQIMMLQVGADSMNYQLKYTHYSMNGHTANCGIMFDEDYPTTEKTDSDSGKAYIDSFFIGNAEEVLDHYVYTDHPSSGEGGRWYPQERNQQWKLHKILPEGQTTEIYPVYFIALKASLTDPRDCHWVCEPTQHATNELVNGSTGYFYFNWGILAPESESVGKYALTETRGNAYMYGDNLICGQISTLAGNSYFDLTHGNFVLSKDGPDNHGQYHEGLTYINGVLTIYGFAKDSDIQNVLTQLGLVDDKAGAAALAAEAAAAAASAAQQAANAAQQAVDNVTNDGIISKGTEKQELNREFIIIAGSNRDGEGTDGSYYKNATQADEYGLDHSALDQAFADLYAAMKIVLGTDANTGKIDGSNIHSDTYIGGLKNNVATYDIEMILGGNRYQGASLFAFNDNGYSTGVTIKKDSKYKLTVAEKSGTSDIDVISDSATFGWVRLTHFGTDEQTETNLVKEFTNTTTGELVLAAGEEGQQVTIDTFTVLEYVKVGPTEFNDLWKNYYDAEVSLLNAINEASIGGENMIETMGREYEATGTYTGYSYLSIPFRRINNMGGYTAFPIGKYVFSAEKISILRTGGAGIPPTGISVKIVDSTSRSYNTIADVGWGDNMACKFELTTAKPLFLRVSWQSSEECRVYIKDAMLQLGTKQTAYQDYVKHLTDALQGSTEIAGGLLMTNVLMLKNEQGEVISGMSGLTKDGENVAMWSGGTYEQALAHATAFAQHTMHELAKILPVLITKNGYGSHIGCFTIEDENTVYVENAAQTERIKIDTTDGIIISTRASRTGTYVDKVRISGNTIDKVSIYGESLSGTYSVSQDIVGGSTGHSSVAKFEYTFATLNLSGGTGNWSAAFQATKIRLRFYNDVGPTKYGWDSVKVYIGSKLILNGGAQSVTCGPLETHYLIWNLSTFSTIASGTHAVKVVFTNFYEEGSSVVGNDFVRLVSVQFANLSGSDYVDSSINFSNVASKDIIEIGSNGIQVSHKNGGFVQMLNDGTDLYVRMFGLPNASGTSRRGELYMIPSTGEIRAHT